MELGRGHGWEKGAFTDASCSSQHLALRNPSGASKGGGLESSGQVSANTEWQSFENPVWDRATNKTHQPYHHGVWLSSICCLRKDRSIMNPSSINLPLVHPNSLYVHLKSCAHVS